MNMKQTFDTINKMAEEAGKQLADISRKLEANKTEKAKAEAEKAAALVAKDEQAYRAACRAIADADAGIEFNTICLQEAQQKQTATDADDRKIKAELQQGLKELYSNAVESIEKALNTIHDIANDTLKECAGIDSMVNLWDVQVMKHPKNNSPFTTTQRLSMQTFVNFAKGRLDGINSLRDADPLLKKNGGK